MREALTRFVRARLPETMSDAIGRLLFEMKAARIARRAARPFQALRNRQALKLHIGAGDDIRPGWVNIDLALRIPPQIDPAAHPDTVFINHDLRRGLPLPDGSCDYVYSSHFLEHLEYGEGLRLMRECHRVLRSGGTFRAALPNFRTMFQAYLDGNQGFFESVNLGEVRPDVEEGTESLVDFVNYGVYQGGEHKSIYDEEKLTKVLRQIGFRSVAAVPYQEGMDPALPLRARHSFYVEAVK